MVDDGATLYRHISGDCDDRIALDYLPSEFEHDARGYESNALRRAPQTLVFMGALGTLCLATLFLGFWQLERRVWKLRLIEQITQRLQEAATDAPGPSEWPRITPHDAYRRIRITGQYLNDRETLVRAVTRLGPGFWVMTPLRTLQNYTVLVNRGYVPHRSALHINGVTEVRGLLRLSEPKGGFLHSNSPTTNQWYSRDVLAMGAAQKLSRLAPFFIDAEASSGTISEQAVNSSAASVSVSASARTDTAASAPIAPVGGLTVIRLPNNHLVYAFTWFTLATMLAGAVIYIGRLRQ